MTEPTPQWERVHPLSPLVRIGRIIPLLFLGLLEALKPRSSNASGGSGRSGSLKVYLVIACILVLLGIIQWLVTRWSVDAGTIRIESGLIRRDARALPLARIQAVDIYEPFFARILKLAELRIRIAGGGRDMRIAYIPVEQAHVVRAALLAAHHGLDQTTAPPSEQGGLTVPTGRLLGSVALSFPMFIFLPFVGGEIMFAVLTRQFIVVASSSIVYVIAFGGPVMRRFLEQYHFTVAVASDGLRIRRGLLSTVNETIPFRRIQAVRLVEPLLWRLLGWCRLEVHLAGVPGRERGVNSGPVTKMLLPVGSRATANAVRNVILGASTLAMEPPPRRAAWKSPLRYHFLAEGHDQTLVCASTGRVRQITTWVPFEKLQSVRCIQGPAQRRLGLATVRVDVAGRSANAILRDRDEREAHQLVELFSASSREERLRLHDAGLMPAAGWI